MSKYDSVLTIDVGLTNCKVSLFNHIGQLLAEVAHPYVTDNPQPNRFEQDVFDWWIAIKRCAHELAQQSVFDDAEVSVISVTAHMHGLVAIDSSRSPITKCWTLFDRRAEAEAKELHRRLGPRNAYHITGGRLEAYTPAAKILWIIQNSSEVAARVHKFLSPKDTIRLLLGGDIYTDPIDAAGSLLYDLRNETWSEQIMSAIGINESQLPEIRSPTKIAGHLSAEAASQLHLKAGIPIVVGSGDDIEALGAGIVAAGQVLEHIGTTGTVICCTDQYLEDDNQVVELYPHAIPNMYLVGGATNAAGRSLDWIKKLLFDYRETVGHLPLDYSRIPDERAMPFYLPYILGERGLLWNNHATGVFTGLRENHNRSDIARAVYEGVAFSLREILEGIKGLGIDMQEIISGTSPDNLDWSRLRSDIYGKPIWFPEQSNLTGLGAAMVGLVGIDVYDDLETAVSECKSRREEVAPDPRMINYYEGQWKQYKRILPIASQLFQ